MVYPALLPLMRTTRLPVVDRTDAHRRFKWTRPFRRKTKSSFCACAIIFQLDSNTELLLKAYFKRTHNTATFNRLHIDSNQLLPTDRHHRTIYTGASDVASNTEGERIKPMVKRMKNQIKRTVKKIWFPLFDSLFVIQVNSICYKVFGRTEETLAIEE